MQWKIAGVLIVTVACLVWFLWGIDARAVAVSLAGIRWGWIGLAVGGYLRTHLFRSWRLQALLTPRLDFADIFTVNCIGYLAINVVPLRLGEFVRPYLFLERHSVPFGAATAAIFLERLIDLLCLVIMLLMVAGLVDLPPGGVVVGDVDVVQAGQIVAGGMVAAGAAGLAVVVVGGAPLVALVGRLTGWVPVVGAALPAFLESFQGGIRGLLRTPTRALQVAVYSAAMWTSTVFGVWFTLLAFDGLPGRLDVALTSWAITLSGMTAAPTPGFFGSFEAFCAAALMLFGADPDVARTFAVVHHLSLFGFTTSVGLAFLLKEGLSLGRIVRESRAAAG